MNADVTGRPATAPTVAVPVDAPGTDTGDGDATAKIVANGSVINSVSEAPRCHPAIGTAVVAAAPWPVAIWLAAETPAPRGQPMVANRCRKILQFPKYCDAPES
jgi:hypothetical protein